MNPTKLVLHFYDFSEIFNEFYKIPVCASRSEKNKLHKGPRVSQTGPQNEDLDYNVVPGRTGSTGGRIPVRGWPDLAGEGARGDPCSPRVRFWCLDGSEVLPVMVVGGVVDLQPQELRLRRGGSAARRV